MIHVYDSVIVFTLGRVMVPAMQLFGLYVLFFGQYGPGGGFVGGVILGTSVVFSILIFGLSESSRRLARTMLHGDGLGLLIFAGVGGLCLIGGGAFLNYAALELPGVDEASRRYLGILLAQIGVAVDVAVTSISIVLSLAATNEEQDSHV